MMQSIDVAADDVPFGKGFNGPTIRVKKQKKIP